MATNGKSQRTVQKGAPASGLGSPRRGAGPPGVGLAGHRCSGSRRAPNAVRSPGDAGPGCGHAAQGEDASVLAAATRRCAPSRGRL